MQRTIESMMAFRLDPSELHAVADRLNTTGCIMTTAHGDQRDGCFVSFLTGCSLSPRRLMVFTSHENLTHELVERSGVLAIHPVARGQEAWTDHFGHETGRKVDKFASVAWQPGVTGSPILLEAMGYIEGRVLASLDCGDHTARLLEPMAAQLRDRQAVPLTIFELFALGLVQPEDPAVGPWQAFRRAT